MGLLGTTPDEATDNAINSLQAGYGAASSSLSPYTMNAGTDFNTERGFLYNAGNNLMQFGNPSSQFYQYAEMNPVDLYNSLVKSYSMSPEEMNEMNSAISAQNNMASASGNYGSGSNDALDSEIAEQSYESGLNDYLHNVGKTVGFDQTFLQDFNNQMSGLMKAFGNLTKTESGASESLATDATRLSQTAANVYAREPNDKNPLGEAMGTILGGVVAGLSKALIPAKIALV